MNKNNLFKALTASTLATVSFACAGVANAVVISGAFGVAGYDVISFYVAAPGTVDFQYTGGYVDPTFSLFDDSGTHLISNDDDYGVAATNSLYSHLTQHLGIGSYSLLVSYCCEGFDYIGANGAVAIDTDGFNTGRYLIGGDGGLSLFSLQAYLDGTAQYWFQNTGSPFDKNGESYELNIQVSSVPVPAAMWLFGSGLLGLVSLGRRKAA